MNARDRVADKFCSCLESGVVLRISDVLARPEPKLGHLFVGDHDFKEMEKTGGRTGDGVEERSVRPEAASRMSYGHGVYHVSISPDLRRPAISLLVVMTMSQPVYVSSCLYTILYI